jgi:hypothetical protein
VSTSSSKSDAQILEVFAWELQQNAIGVAVAPFPKIASDAAHQFVTIALNFDDWATTLATGVTHPTPLLPGRGVLDKMAHH